MSSVLKPSLTASVPQNSSVPSQLNKPMHSQQGPPQSYGQPSNHHPVMSHGNPAVAHNHPTTHQANHFSLNVPNASSHFIGNNQPIPASNHPVANNPPQSSGQPIFGSAKNMSFQSGFQPNLGHPPNVNQSANQLPPISQTLPATNSQLVSETERSHSNGTNENKSNCSQENHVTTPKETSITPALPTQNPSPEKSTEVQKSMEQDKSEESEESTIVAASSSSSSSSSVETVPQKNQVTAKSSESKEVTLPDNESVSAQNELVKKNEDLDNNESKQEKLANADEKVDSAVESESAKIPEENEKASTENKETELKDKSPTTSKSRATTRKVTKVAKSEEESPKSSRSEQKAVLSQKSPSSSKSKRSRIRTQPYQSPLPELEIISKISASSSQRNKANDDKLTVFFKNEFLAVRNSEGSFYICQAVQNIYKSSAKIRIRWLSQDKNDKTNQIYTPDFYDNTDFDCILTNLNLERVEKGKYRLPPAEKERTDSILKRSLAAEKGEEISSPSVTEEHPDGLDLSLYKDENQLNKRKGKKRSATSPLKSSRSSSRNKKKSPDTAKVAKTSNKTVGKETVSNKKLPSVSTPPPKKANVSRMERAKRRSENAINPKVSPVSPKVDQKKAKALAKVARKGVVSNPKAQSNKKEIKVVKPTPPLTSKAKLTVKATTTTIKKRTTKRSLRK